MDLNCVVSHGVGWNGGVRDYHGVVSVDLDENEVIVLQKVLGQCQTDGFDEAKEELPAVYEKIEEAASDFKLYTLVLNDCVHWSEELGDVREEDLIEEDIQSGKFVPLYVNAEGSSRDPFIMNQWFAWMVESLAGLSYKERTEYLVKRYKMELPALEEIDFEVYYSLK